jgi:membrane associated rhomboid family serine protease
MIFLFIALMASVVTASADLSSLAALDTSRVLSGEVWRIFTGHLSHLTWRQFVLDVPAFIFLYLAYCNISGTVAAVSLSLFSSLIVSSSVIFAGMHQVYGGLSGLSCAALSAILLVIIIKNPRQTYTYMLAAVFCIYLVSMRGIASDVTVAWEAHIAGAISGVVFVLIQLWLKKLI